MTLSGQRSRVKVTIVFLQRDNDTGVEGRASREVETIR